MSSSLSVAPGALSPTNHSLSVSGWTPLSRNSLVGVFDVTMPDGMIIRSCMLHRMGGQRWVGLPAAAQLSTDGSVKRAGDGKPLYKTLIYFQTKEIQERFQALVLEELRKLGHI